MKLKQNKKVEFEELTHTYTCGDKFLKGVTTLMAEQGLSPDYSAIPKETLEKAAAHGTAIHKLLEDYDNGEPVVLTDEVKDYPKLGLNIVQSEYLVSDNKYVASSIDKVIMVDENTVDLADVKTTSTLHMDSVAWQLSIYKYLFELQNKNIKVRNLYGIHVRNNKVKLVKVEEVAREEVEKVLECDRKGTMYINLDDVAESASLSLALTENEIAKLTSCTLGIQQIKNTLKELQGIVDEISEKVVDYMVQNHYTEMSCSQGSVKLKDEYTRTSIDSAALKKDYPEIAEKYTKTSTVKASIIFKPTE